MGKLRQLKGIAYNLSDSFIDLGNQKFLKCVESLPKEKTKLIEIDLLKGTILPKDVAKVSVKEAVKEYKRWFIEQIKKLKINLKDVESVIIKVAYKPGKSYARYYTCNVIIKAKGKEYVGKFLSSYS